MAKRKYMNDKADKILNSLRGLLADAKDSMQFPHDQICAIYAVARDFIDADLEPKGIPKNDNKVGRIGEHYAKEHVKKQHGATEINFPKRKNGELKKSSLRL
jgi:hypothetical protein